MIIYKVSNLFRIKDALQVLEDGHIFVHFNLASEEISKESSEQESDSLENSEDTESRYIKAGMS